MSREFPGIFCTSPREIPVPGYLEMELPEKPYLHVKVILMIKTKTIAKGKCFGSPARQRDSLVNTFFSTSRTSESWLCSPDWLMM